MNMRRCGHCGSLVRERTPAKRKFKKGDFVKLSRHWFDVNCTDGYSRKDRYTVVGFPRQADLVLIVKIGKRERHSFHITFVTRANKKEKP